MREIHARAYIEADQIAKNIIVVFTKERGRTRPEIPKEIYKYFESTHYDPDSKYTVIKWYNGSVIYLTCLEEKLISIKAKLYLFDGDDWDEDFRKKYVEPIKYQRYYNEELSNDLGVLLGKNIHPYESKVKYEFVV